MRTPEEFRDKAKEKAISHWNLHECSLCGVGYGFEIDSNLNVFFSTSCGCASSSPKLSDWKEIANIYNVQTNPEVIKKMDGFWGFNNGDNMKDFREQLPEEGARIEIVSPPEQGQGKRVEVYSKNTVWIDGDKWRGI